MAENAQAADLLERAGMRSEIAGGVTGALIADSAENGKIERSLLQPDQAVFCDAPLYAGLMDLYKAMQNGRCSGWAHERAKRLVARSGRCAAYAGNTAAAGDGLLGCLFYGGGGVSRPDC